MSSVLAKKNEGTIFSIAIIFAIWVAYTGLYQVFQSHGAMSGILEFISVNGLNAAVTIYFWNFWKTTHKGSSSRIILLLFALSYSVMLVESCTYHAIYNVLHIPRAQVPIFWMSFYNTLYAVYLLLQFFAWSTILSMIIVDHKKSYLKHVPISFSIIAILFVCFYILGGRAQTSFLGIYDFSGRLLEIIYFFTVILCLIACKNKGLFYFAVGILISEAASLGMDFKLFSQGYGLNSFLETGWVLGKLFMLYGLINLSNSIIEDARAWIISPSHIRAKSVYGCFMVGTSALAVLFALGYVLYPQFF